MGMRFLPGWMLLVRRRILLLLLGCALPAVAARAQVAGVYDGPPLLSYGSSQAPAGNGQVSQQQTHVLAGTVINSFTGAPIPYALVQAGQESKLADQNGNFGFDDLPNVTYVAAHKPGFFGEGEVNDSHAPLPPLTLGDQPTSITVRLIPEAVITGHVEDSEGEPLEGLPLNVRRVQYMNGRRILQQQRGQATDEDGNFRIANVRPGTYYIGVGPNFRARMLPEEQDSSQKAEVFPAVYYPGVHDLSAAMPLRLAPGQHATIDFNLKRAPAYRINGLIAGLTTNNGGLNLLDSEGENANIPVRYDSQTSRFEIFPIPAGSYRLRYNGQDADGQQVFADVPLNVTGNIGELHVGVQRALAIPVEFETEFTKQNFPSQTGIIGSVDSGGGGKTPMFYGQIHLVSRKPPYQQFYSSREKGDSGTVIRGVEPGTYDVETNPNGAAYVASIASGGVDLLHQPLVIAEGAEPQPIEVVLRDDGASLSGSVQFPDGTQTAQVLMIAEGTGSDAPRSIFVDRTGNFRAQELAPGTYDILAFDRLDGIEYGNREALNAYLGQATHVTLSADQQAKVTVGVIRTQQ